MKTIIDLITKPFRIIIETASEIPKVVIEKTAPVSAGNPIIALIIVGFLGLSLLYLLSLGFQTLEEKVINKVAPSYETSKERTARIKKETTDIDVSLEKWLNRQFPDVRGVRRHRSAKNGETIWVEVFFRYRGHSHGYINLLLYSPDNAKSWAIRWERGETDIEGSIDTIEIIDQQRVCVRFLSYNTRSGLKHQMMYTLDGGKKWKIHDKWDPSIVK